MSSSFDIHAVRRAQREDLASLSRLGQQVQLLHRQAAPAIFCSLDSDSLCDFFAGELARDEVQILVGHLGEEVVGYAYTVLEDRPATVFTHPRRRLKLEHLVGDLSIRATVGPKL